MSGTSPGALLVDRWMLSACKARIRLPTETILRKILRDSFVVAKITGREDHESLDNFGAPAYQ
jgi:hypothetical protein